MDETEAKAGALLLWGLMGTAEGELAKFRRQRIGRTSQLELDHLREVQAMLRALAEAIRNDDDARWKSVHEAAKVLCPPAAQPPPSAEQQDTPVADAATTSSERSRPRQLSKPTSAEPADSKEKPPAETEPRDTPALSPSPAVAPAPVAVPPVRAPESPWAAGARAPTWREPGPGARVRQPGESGSEEPPAQPGPAALGPSKPPRPTWPQPPPSKPEDRTSLLPDSVVLSEPSPAEDEQPPASKTATAQYAPKARALPFVPPEPGKRPAGKPVFEPPDPEDPESETIRLRQHVMPFKKKRHAPPAPSSEADKAPSAEKPARPEPAAATPAARATKPAEGKPRSGPIAAGRPSPPGAPPVSLPTRVVGRARPPTGAPPAQDDESTQVSSLAKTIEREPKPGKIGSHGLPVLHDDEDEDYKPTRVRPVLVASKLGRYAQFCAECVVFPERVPQIRSKYGLVSKAEHQELDGVWMGRFAARPELREQWQELFELKRDELERKKKS